MRISDWSSDVCSSDLPRIAIVGVEDAGGLVAGELAIIGVRALVRQKTFGNRPAQLTHRHRPSPGACSGTGCSRSARSMTSAKFSAWRPPPWRICSRHEKPLATITVESSAARTAGSSDCSRSEEHTSELQSLMRISYAVFCLKKKKKTI